MYNGRPGTGGESASVKTNRPAVSKTSLFSYLVTRPTGRAVRSSIEERLSEFDREVLSVLDFHEVTLIDFSCADEVVAKLLLEPERPAARDAERFFLFRGVGDHHIDPIDSALRRQELAAAAEDSDGRPLLLGSIGPVPAAVWRAVWQAGFVSAEEIARTVGIAEADVENALIELEARRLVIRFGDRYASFGWALEEADGRER